MKGNEKVIESLNGLLADELTGINQYIVHEEMDENWGYEKLTKSVHDRSIVEMKHAEKLIARILFLEGKPVVSHLNQINIGKDVPQQLANDLNLEMSALQHYNAAIKVAVEVGDNATKDILEKILDDEDAHVDDIEGKQDRIEQMGIQNFLNSQVEQ